MRSFSIIAIIAIGNSMGLGASLPRSSPEAQGVSSAGALSFVEAADRDLDALHSFMLVRHGHVVAEGWWSPYNAQSLHSLFSLSKRFTSTAVGLAVAEGQLSVDDTVLKFFPENAATLIARFDGVERHIAYGRFPNARFGSGNGLLFGKGES